jgi:hypothetical protein
MIHHQSSEPDPARSIGLGPDYLVGRDDEGHWLAIETRGLGGGMFRSAEAAIRYAGFETDHRPGAVLVSTEPLVLRL